MINVGLLLFFFFNTEVFISNKSGRRRQNRINNNKRTETAGIQPWDLKEIKYKVAELLMAVSKLWFSFSLVPEQRKVTNTRTKFFKSSSFRLGISLNQRPPGMRRIRSVKPRWSPALAFWAIHVCSHRGLWRLPRADTGAAASPESKRAKRWVLRGRALLGGSDPAVHSLEPPRNSDLLKRLGAPGFELSFKELFW